MLNRENSIPRNIHPVYKAIFFVNMLSMALSQRFLRHTRCRLIHVEKRIEELGIVLPSAPTPKANYNIVCYANNNMLYISGHLPIMPDGSLIKGRIGEGGESVEHGYKAARQVGLNLISTMKEQLGNLDRVEQVVKVRLNFLFSYYSNATI
jgi:enamine deaminase RidA (YjgF/YER057c/UK114 family)